MANDDYKVLKIRKLEEIDTVKPPLEDWIEEDIMTRF